MTAAFSPEGWWNFAGGNTPGSTANDSGHPGRGAGGFHPHAGFAHMLSAAPAGADIHSGEFTGGAAPG